MPVSVLLMCVYISHVTVLFTSVFLIILKYTNVHIQCALAQGLTGCGGTQACLYLDPPTTITVLTLEGKLRVLAAVHGYHNSPGHFVPRFHTRLLTVNSSTPSDCLPYSLIDSAVRNSPVVCASRGLVPQQYNDKSVSLYTQTVHRSRTGSDT